VAGAREYVVAAGLFDELPPAETTLRLLMAWTALFGTVSFELFGHLVGSVDDGASWFDAVAVRLGSDRGIVVADAVGERDAAAAAGGR
jgi:hypothetical protein